MTFSLRTGRTLDNASLTAALKACMFHQGTKWLLAAVAVMPTHGTHLLCQPLERRDVTTGECHPLQRILQSVKSFSARRINELQGVSGPVWCQESFDRQIRTEADFLSVALYIANNPVKEGLAAHPGDYPWLYLDPEIRGSIEATFTRSEHATADKAR